MKITDFSLPREKFHLSKRKFGKISWTCIWIVFSVFSQVPVDRKIERRIKSTRITPDTIFCTKWKREEIRVIFTKNRKLCHKRDVCRNARQEIISRDGRDYHNTGYGERRGPFTLGGVQLHAFPERFIYEALWIFTVKVTSRSERILRQTLRMWMY